VEKQIDQLVVERAANITALKKHAAWPDYEQAIREIEEKLKTRLVKQLIAGSEPSLDDVYYTRGALYMLKKFRDVVENAEDTVERSLRQSKEKA
jgi:hypothetical protein